MRVFHDIFKAFCSRPLTFALLLYQFLFFNVFLPGHTRGSITLDGKHCADPAPCCCCCCEKSDPPKSGSQQAPSKHDKEECAICHFAARVLPVAVVSFVMPELGLLETRDPERPHLPVTADPVAVYHSRGPPSLV